MNRNNQLYLERFNNAEIERLISEHGVQPSNNGTLLTDVSLIGFCHNIRVNKNMIFVVFRKATETIQLIVFKNKNPETYDTLTHLKDEATIEVHGDVVEAKVKTCTVTQYEVQVKTVTVINRSSDLPFSLDNANETFCSDSSAVEEEEKSDRCSVGRIVRLNNRWLDLRIPINQHIFRLRSAMEASIREVLIDDGFCEIHTPKIIPAVSEGGANVFEVSYFGKKVYLAQSPQLYKQMMINAGFQRVFEIGPVFRAENANTYRHMCEFTGLDMEFEITPSHDHIDIVKTIWSVFYRVFEKFYNKNKESIDYVLSHTKTDKLILPVTPVIIDFKEGCRMLNDAGHTQSELEDIGSVNEKILGEIVKEKHGTDFYVLVGYPSSVRPFYTMGLDEQYSRSFDIMMRGNEISSGAQRVHDPDVLEKAILDKGIKLDGKSGLEDYLNSFKTGSMPHGGCGVGLERLLMLYLGLTNVRNTSLFPRDPKRITP